MSFLTLWLNVTISTIELGRLDRFCVRCLDDSDPLLDLEECDPASPKRFRSTVGVLGPDLDLDVAVLYKERPEEPLG